MAPSAYVEQALAPTLSPGDIVIMDNLGSHKVAGVREAIEAAGATQRFLPAYTALTSILSNRFSPSSKTRCEKWLTEPSMPFGKASAAPSMTSLQTNV